MDTQPTPSTRRGIVAAGVGLVASSSLVLAMIPFASSAGATQWQSQPVTSADTRISDTSTNPAGTTYTAWVDGTDVKVSARSTVGWSAPVTIYANPQADGVTDVDILATSDSIMVTIIEDAGTSFRLRAIRYSSSTSTWSSATTIVSRSTGSVPLRNATLTHSGSRYYTSVEYFERNDPDSSPRNVYSARFHRSVGADNDWDEIDRLTEADRVEQGRVVASGPRYLSYAWLDGILVKVAFFDITGNDWDPNDVRTLNTTASGASYVSIAGSRDRSTSGTTGIIAYDRSSSTEDRAYVSVLADDEVSLTQQLPSTNTRRVSAVTATWSASADRGAVIYANAEHSVYAAVTNTEDGRFSQTRIGQGTSTVRDLAVGSTYANSTFRVTAAWQRGTSTSGAVEVQRYESSWQASPANLGTGSYPMIAGTSTPMVLAWGTSRPYALTAYRYEQNPGPTPGPEPEPGDASIMLSGSRNANQPKRVVLTGTTVNIAQGREIQPYWRLNKRGKQWKELPTRILNDGTDAAGSFRIGIKRSNVRRNYSAYVTIGDVTSNRIVIRRAR